MTTMAAVGLSDAVRTLIDARLDTIDRMLLGRVPRSDRLAIVREVEGQIHDLLGERGAEEPDRDDVLAVLARLDPPEAYLPEESDGTPAAGRVPSSPRAARASRDPAPAASRVSGIVGLCALGLFLLALVFFVIGLLSGSVVLIYAGGFGATGLSLIVGLVAVPLAFYAQLRGPWAIVGLVTGILSALFSLLGAVTLVVLG
jgi:hypothetical protein